MKQQANNKSERFRVEIRRRQRDDIMKINRQIKQEGLQQRKKPGPSTMVKENKIQSQDGLKDMIKEDCQTSEKVIEVGNKAKKLYDEIKENTNYLDTLSQESVTNILYSIICQEYIEANEGISLLGTFIQYSGFTKVNKKKRESILRVFQKVHIQQIIFKEIDKNIKNENKDKVKLLLNCIKFLACNQMEAVRRKQLLEQYLPALIEKYLDQPSTLIFLSYASEVHLFHHEIIQQICHQCQSKLAVVKLVIVSILNNYITLQSDLNTIAIMFEPILRTLMHIIVNNKGQSLNATRTNLQTIIKLISKYPEGREAELLTKISKCKFQELALVMLTVCDESVKQLIYQIQETIIEKCIHQLKDQFFIRFNMEVIYLVVQGIEHTRASIIGRCLGILVKIVKYAPQHVIKKIQCQNFISVSLDSLCYHKNQRIVDLAQFLYPFFSKDSQLL